ncbi:MAG: hypothetical protein OXF39_10775 [Nitrospira sp.]|nr:hypothetical protein [Nitrospira sp.]
MKQTTIILIALGTFITGNPSARAESDNPFGFETNKHPLEYEYCKKEPGSKLADLKVQFWLVTNDACLRKIDEKANRAF